MSDVASVFGREFSFFDSPIIVFGFSRAILGPGKSVQRRIGVSPLCAPSWRAGLFFNRPLRSGWKMAALPPRSKDTVGASERKTIRRAVEVVWVWNFARVLV